ncbi:hypothetical protein M885DRAFT_518661 [Pelagophyceae sp. CCMP2097]|nr:hypothetical protein M885DRAFT_518661 [Pelagophyceae sp. CCMP2097]
MSRLMVLPTQQRRRRRRRRRRSRSAAAAATASAAPTRRCANTWSRGTPASARCARTALAPRRRRKLRSKSSSRPANSSSARADLRLRRAARTRRVGRNTLNLAKSASDDDASRQKALRGAPAKARPLTPHSTHAAHHSQRRTKTSIHTDASWRSPDASGI